MNEKKSFLKEFVRLTAIAFSSVVLTLSAIGWFFDDAAAMLHLGDAGLSYQTIFQIFLFSVTNSVLSLVITKIFKNMMVLWQLIITMFACLTASGIIVAIFGWIPMDSWRAWLWFAITFAGAFTIVATAMVVRIRLADKHYEKLLTDYKVNQEKEKPV